MSTSQKQFETNAADKLATLVVLGMHRSGTSALSRVLGLAGLQLPTDDIGSKRGNEQGHWESLSIVEFNDVLLNQCGSHWTDWREPDLQFLHGAQSIQNRARLAKRLKKAFPGDTDLVLKDPRLSVLAPFYFNTLAKEGRPACAVVIVRNPLEVTASLEARDNISSEHSALLWLRYNLDAERHSRNVPRAIVSFDDLMNRPVRVVEKISQETGFAFAAADREFEKTVNEFIDGANRHHRETSDSLLENLMTAGWISRCFSALMTLRENPNSEAAMNDLDEIREQFLAAEPMIEHLFDLETEQRVQIHKKNVEEYKVRNSELEASCDELKSGAAEKDEKLRKLYSYREHLLDRISDFQSDLDRLGGQLSTKSLRLSEAKKELQHQTEISVQLKTELDWHVAKLAESAAAMKIHNSEIVRLGDLWASTQKQVAEITKQRAELSEALNAERFSMGSLKESLKEAKRGLNTVKGQLTREKKAHAKLGLQFKTVHDDLAGQIAALRAENAKLTEDVSELKSAHIDLSDTLMTTQRDNESLESALAQARAQYTETSSALENLWRENSDISASLSASHASVSELQGTLAQALEQYTETSSALENLRRENSDISASLSASHASVSELQGALAGAQKQYSDIINSRLWRSTSVLRKVVNQARNLRHKIGVRFSGPRNKDGIEEPASLEEAVSLSHSMHVGEGIRNLSKQRSKVAGSAFHKAYCGDDWLSDDQLPTITISMVLFNSEKWLEGFFKSLGALDYPKTSLTLAFVDHGSSDETVGRVRDFVESHHGTYRNITLTERPNSGYGAGNDFAIRQSEDEFILVTNVDVEFDPASLRHAVNVAVKDVENAACWEFRQVPYEHPKYYDPITLETNWCAHACVLLRRHSYLAVGGYETKLFMYGEDVELSYRFRSQGFILRYLPAVKITHFVDFENTAARQHQLSGSVAANVLLRYRYGSYRDIIGGEGLLRWVKRSEQDPARLEKLSTASEIVSKHRRHFFKNRVRKSHAEFPFREFDYDIVRDGADISFGSEANQDVPLVSVVTRTHGDRSAHLKNAMISVLNQTYENIEHVIVEDRTSNAKVIVDEFLEAYPDANIVYHRSDSGGRSAAGNLGFAKATGEYFCILDDDDFFFADHIEILINGLRENPDNVAAYSLAWDAQSGLQDGEHREFRHTIPNGHRAEFSHARILVENFIPIQAIMFSRRLFEQFGGFHDDIDVLEDWNLWVRYSQAGHFLHVPKVTSVYRTPNNDNDREARAAILNAAYESVSQRNREDIEAINGTKRFPHKSGTS